MYTYCILSYSEINDEQQIKIENFEVIISTEGNVYICYCIHT